MRVTWGNEGTEVLLTELTFDQWESLERIQKKWFLPDPIEIWKSIGSDDYITIDVGMMLLGIEKDGHTHS